ncbi:MAG TPA: hypothetical protein VGO62_05390, partial [Myxococcota bacterium]
MPTTHKTTTGARKTRTSRTDKAAPAKKAAATEPVVPKTAQPAKADHIVSGGRPLGKPAEVVAAGSGHHASDVVAVRASTASPKNKDIIHEITTRKQFDSLFAQGASVTAGAPTELKFLIDRKSHEIYFVPPKYPFHYTFYQDVL